MVEAGGCLSRRRNPVQMYLDVCADMCIELYANMCGGVRTHVDIDMCVDMHIDMGKGMCVVTDLGAGQCNS